MLAGPLALILRLLGWVPGAAIAFLAGSLVSRYGWLETGRASGVDPETTREAQRRRAARPASRRDGHPDVRSPMSFSREDVQDSVKRAGDEHWQRLVDHHEDAYPASPPTPGEVCRREAARLDETGLGGSEDWELLETRIEPSGTEIEVVHVLRFRPLDLRLRTEPYVGYGG